MTLERNIRKFMPLLITLFLFALIGFGCDDPAFQGPAQDNTFQTPTQGSVAPTDRGPYTKCTYSSDNSDRNGRTAQLSDRDYRDAIVYYPCEKNAGPFPATTLTGGFTNTKEEMDWVGSHVVTHGYVVIAMTPNNEMGTNIYWRQAHNAGIAKLKSENNRSGSPISGLVNTNALQIMGFSKGGGGTLLAASDQGAAVKSAQALAPYMDSQTYNINGVRAATICYTGTDDRVAPPQPVVRMYNSLPFSIEKTLAYFRSMPHAAWMMDGTYEQHQKALTYITSWMKVHLSGDSSYAGYIDGSQNWFFRFEQGGNSDQSFGGGGLPPLSPGCGLLQR